MNDLDIPTNQASINEIIDFALSFNGYYYVNGGPYELSLLYDKVVLNPELASIDELRACLFFLQRAVRWNHNEWQSSDIEEAHGILDLIRQKQKKLI